MKTFLLKRKFNCIKKLANIFEFYKSTLVVNFAVCLVASLFGKPHYLPFIFVSYGFILSLVFKEIYHKNDYLFYCNNGISKIQLMIFSCCFNIVFTVFSFTLFHFIRQTF